jgi:hypothetical protein
VTAVLLRGRGRVDAEVNWGRWIVRCPACPSALAVVPLVEAVDCEECAARIEVHWPAPDMLYGVARLLSMRPDPHTRSWTPTETLHDLILENALHGIFARLAGAAAVTPGETLLWATEDRITTDLLPALPGRTMHALEG